MNERMRQLLDQIHVLHDEVQGEVNKQRDRLGYRIQGETIQFGQAVREHHRQLKSGLFQQLMSMRSLNLLTAPEI